MATFVLVHGAWHGSWCWKRVRAALFALGHEVFTPTLSGLGERSHLLAPEVDLDTHINDIINLIRWEELSDVVLCGHSYAGSVVCGVADRIPESIRALVYLDAFVPESGQCVYDMLPADQHALQLQLVRDVGEGWKVPPIPAEVFNVNPGDRAWVDSQCTMQPLATFEQPLTLGGETLSPERITYILATGFVDSPFPPIFDRARDNGWHTLTVECGHDVMLDRPDELVRILTAGVAPVAS